MIRSYCVAIPKIAYPKLKEICAKTKAFKSCTLGQKAVTEEMMTRKKICPIPEDKEKMKTRLDELSVDIELSAKLSEMDSKLAAF